MTRRIVKLIEVQNQAGYSWATERFLRRLVAERRIPFHKLDKGKVLIDLGDLDRYIERSQPNHPGLVYAYRGLLDVGA